MKKRNKNNSFQNGFLSTLGEVSAIKIIGLVVLLGGGGISIKQCSDSQSSTEQSEPRPMSQEQQQKMEAEEAVKGRG